MTSNGFTRGGRSGRTPHFLTVGLLVVICILAFNYWNISSKNKVLDVLNAKMKDNLEELVLRKVHLEKQTETLNRELTGNNQVVQETQEKANTCQENLREVGDERDQLRAKAGVDAEEIKQLQRSVEDFNDTLSQLQDDLTDLRKENREMQQQLNEMNTQVVKARQEVQYREDQLRLSQHEVEQHKTELDSLRQQLQQQQMQQAQLQPQLNSRRVELANAGANTPEEAANQQLVFNNAPQQNAYQQQQQLLQNKYGQLNNNYIPQLPGNQLIREIPRETPRVMAIPGGNPPPLGGIPGNLPGQLDLQMNRRLPDRALEVPEVPKYNLPDMRQLGGGGGGEHQQDVEGSPAQELNENQPEAPVGGIAKEEAADKPSDSLPVDNRVDGDSPNNGGEDFIQGDMRRNDAPGHWDENLGVPVGGDQDDSQHAEGQDGPSKLESPSDAVNEHQDPNHAVDGPSLGGRDDDIKFIGRKDDFGNEESEEKSPESSYDYEDDDNNEEAKVVNEGENQIVPGNMNDFGAGDEGLGFQLEPAQKLGGGMEDDGRLRFNEG